jgi:hypothetical protein
MTIPMDPAWSIRDSFRERVSLLEEARSARLLVPRLEGEQRRIAVGVASSIEVRLVGVGLALEAGPARAWTEGRVIVVEGAAGRAELDLGRVPVDRQYEELRALWLAARGTDEHTPATLAGEGA